jgi:hypothetical protein
MGELQWEHEDPEGSGNWIPNYKTWCPHDDDHHLITFSHPGVYQGCEDDDETFILKLDQNPLTEPAYGVESFIITGLEDGTYNIYWYYTRNSSGLLVPVSSDEGGSQTEISDDGKLVVSPPPMSIGDDPTGGHHDYAYIIKKQT